MSSTIAEKMYQWKVAEHAEKINQDIDVIFQQTGSNREQIGAVELNAIINLLVTKIAELEVQTIELQYKQD